ncbi:MAG: hypothetical protein ACYTBJ_26730 [Planctomycetota bacterium]
MKYKIKGLIRYARHCSRVGVRFKAYDDPEAVGGWIGWYEQFGQCLAFKKTDGTVLYRW